MSENNNVIQWFLDSAEPWTRYRTRLDLLGQKEDYPAVQQDRNEMIVHPQVKAIIAGMGNWGEAPFKRHNDASYSIYKFSTLADFGIHRNDPGMSGFIENILSHQSPEGSFQSVVNIPKSFGGSGEDVWTWMICDAPTLLYALLSMGMEKDPRIQLAVNHLASLGEPNGYHCVVDPCLGKFKGPGARSDPCPIANVYALKVFAKKPDLWNNIAVQSAAEMLLQHWACLPSKKYFLFGAGTDFKKLKYPFVWYDILHVADVLSCFPFLREDPRFKNMVDVIAGQADEKGLFTAGSMYLSWKGWSFADKKNPSPWLTFLVYRIFKRMGCSY